MKSKLFLLVLGLVLIVVVVGEASASSYACSGGAELSFSVDRPRNFDDVVKLLIQFLRFLAQLFVNVFCAIVRFVGLDCR